MNPTSKIVLAIGLLALAACSSAPQKSGRFRAGIVTVYWIKQDATNLAEITEQVHDMDEVASKITFTP